MDLVFGVAKTVAGVAVDATETIAGTAVAGVAVDATKSIAGTALKGTGKVASGILGEDIVETVADMVETVGNITTTVGGQIFDALVDETCDDQVKEVIAFVAKMFEKTKVKTKMLKARQVGKPLTLILALMCRLHHHKKNQRIQQECCEDAKLSFDAFTDAKSIAQWAIDIYRATWNPSQIKEKMKLGPDDDILMQFCKDDDSVNDRVYTPKFIIFTHPQTRSIVLAIRGTNDLNDVVIDLLAEEEEFLDGMAHSGMLKAAFRVINDTADVLKNAFKTYPDYRLVITGHSLGAGVSAIIHLGIRSGTFKDVIPQTIELKTILLAPPPVYKATEIPDELTKEITAFVQGNDCVPRLSSANIDEFFEKAYALGKLELTQSQIFKLLTEQSDEEVDACLEAMNEATEKVQTDKFQRLNHVGNVYYIPEKEPKMFKVNGGFFDDSFLLLKMMIWDHLQPNYRKALDKVTFTN